MKDANVFAPFDLTGRVSVVTGGLGLLGRQFCRTLAGAGSAVVIVDIDGQKTAALSEEMEKEGYRVLGSKTDITHPAAVQSMVRSTLKTFGRLDVLVNSAALDPKFDPAAQAGQATPLGSFEYYPVESWKQALDVNLTGMFLCCQAAVRPMLEQGRGVIINICSTYGLVGPDQRLYQREGRQSSFKPVYYSVTKAGVLGLTRYLAAYYAGRNIRVNALSPGGVFHGHEPEFLKAYSARTVLGRMAEPGEMNGALLFLASDASSYMTGANLVVDGGWTAW
jgi:NAD(P)-dependent dehydrogenase (short-subunit alcohol dehydrogenase family)